MAAELLVVDICADPQRLALVDALLRWSQWCDLSFGFRGIGSKPLVDVVLAGADAAHICCLRQVVYF